MANLVIVFRSRAKGKSLSLVDTARWFPGRPHRLRGDRLSTYS
jgi:hypothetical protein